MSGMVWPDDGRVDLATVLPTGVIAGTDLATAHLVVHFHGQDLRFVREIGWLAWDEQRWAPDSTGEVCRRIHEIGCRLEVEAARLRVEASQVRGRDKESKAEADAINAEAQKLSAWASYCQSATGINHVRKVVETLAGVQARPRDLDSDPWLFNCLSGTIDLRSGGIREHRRQDMITRLASVSFDAQAAAPMWRQCVQTWLPDAEVRDFMQRYLGYSMTGSTAEQCFVVAIGNGANGKSVLAETVRCVLGDYAADTPTDTLMKSKHGRGSENDIARLRGSRFVTVKETEENKRLDEARAKALSGGDTVTARFLFKEWFEYRPSFKLLLHANHKPIIRGTDDGIWRRIMLVMFGVTIPPEDRDPDLGSKLRAEAPGILAWLVEGCLRWQETGLAAPEAVRAATDAYRAESDELAQFIVDCCAVGDFAKTKATPLFSAYQKWAAEQGNKSPMARNVFGERLKQAGFEAARTNAEGRVWRGIGLLAEEDPREQQDYGEYEGRHVEA